MPEEQVVDSEVIAKEIGPAIDKALQEASQIAASVVDDPSRERAIDLGVHVREQIEKAKDWREKFYIPVMRSAKNLASFCDPRIKQGKAILELLSAKISEYDVKKRREAQLAKEKAEAAARAIQEEADRKQREAEEAERKAKEAAEAEARRKKEAEEAEARRVQAEKEAKARAEEEARKVERKEREAKLAEEEDARLKHAETAEDVGNEHKVENILDQATPIAPVVAAATTARSEEQLKIEQDLAAKEASNRAEKETKEAAEAEARRKKEEEAAAARRKEADEAAEAARVAQAAVAASTAITARRPDKRLRTTETWKWSLDGDPREAFLKLVKAVLEGRAPIEYLGFNPEKPEKFRPKAINGDVTTLKGEFKCDGIRAFPQEDKHFKASKSELEI